MSKSFRNRALQYHSMPIPGKLTVQATKRLADQYDLALAYSPGVAYPCEEIAVNPEYASKYTARGNLVGVISNGSAVLGLGDIGALACKPVMEGKAILFKQFAGIDAFDIEIDEANPDRLAEIISSLEPTFGAINLEDIKAPDCFILEQKLRSCMNIPVFHDDQHGTAITVAAGVLNGLTLCDKDIKKVKVVSSGAGAAALACLDLLVSLGVDKRNIIVTDISGVLYQGRKNNVNSYNQKYAIETNFRTLSEAIVGSDVFLGLSAGKVLTKDMVKSMSARPLIFALANPEPEILPEEIKSVRSDAIIATGRSDYPNQINNVLCFPFLFRGALDVGARCINNEMKLACVKAIAGLVDYGVSETVEKAYQGESFEFGEDYILPKPFDPRLLTEIPVAVAKAAMETKVAKIQIEDLEEYRRALQNQRVG